MRDNNGESVFYVLQVFKACEKCREESDEAAAACPHNNHILPSWNSARKTKLIRAMMSEEMFLQELMGMCNAKYQRAFEKKFVEHMFNQPLFTLDTNYNYPHLFVSIDPNGLGKASDLGIVSFIKFRGMFIIVGLEAFPGKTAIENHSRIVSHVRELQNKYSLRAARVVFIVENNMGDTADTTIAMLRDQINNFIVLQDNNPSKLGTRTTNTVKISAVEFVRECMVETRFQFVQDEDFVSLTQPIRDVKAKFRNQLEEFVEVLTDKEFKKPTRQFSGKRNMLKDDLCLAYILGIYWSTSFYRDPKYQNYH